MRILTIALLALTLIVPAPASDGEGTFVPTTVAFPSDGGPGDGLTMTADDNTGSHRSN